MFMVKYASVCTGATCVGAGMLLFALFGSPEATPERPRVPEVRPAAQPFDLVFSRVLPWAVGEGTPISSTGAVAASAHSLLDGVSAAMGAASTLATENRFGPFAADLDSIRAFSLSQATPDGEPTRINITDGDQWSIGLAGLANSTGVLGVTTGAALGDPLLADYAGVLQTTNQFGPAFFDLNVLKALSFTQAPPGTVLPNGAPDNAAAVDIGRWAAGVPGVITNTGTTGFVAYTDYGAGPITNHWVGGLHTTTQIGPMTFDYNFLPAVTASTTPPGITFSLAPDLTAAGTPFAGPPPPGVVEPLVTALAPAVAPAPSTAAPSPAASEPSPAVPDADAPTSRTSVNETAPGEAVIPGVNGAPLCRAPRFGTSGGAGGGPSDPFKRLADEIADGITGFTRAPGSTGPTAGTTANSGGPGTDPGSGTGGNG